MPFCTLQVLQSFHTYLFPVRFLRGLAVMIWSGTEKEVSRIIRKDVDICAFYRRRILKNIMARSRI